MIAAQVAPWVLIMMMVVLFIIIFFGQMIMLVRFYKKAPAGKVMVINKIARIQVTRSGSVVLPIVWSHTMVHCEVEEVAYDGPNGLETVLLCLDDSNEAVMLAYEKFGTKSVDEIKSLLTRLLKNSGDRDADLAKVGYKVIC